MLASPVVGTPKLRQGCSAFHILSRQTESKALNVPLRHVFVGQHAWCRGGEWVEGRYSAVVNVQISVDFKLVTYSVPCDVNTFT